MKNVTSIVAEVNCYMIWKFVINYVLALYGRPTSPCVDLPAHLTTLFRAY